MHSMHQIQTHSATSIHIQQQQQQQSTTTSTSTTATSTTTTRQDQHLASNGSSNSNSHDQQQIDMTVLESLEPAALPQAQAQPILSTLDPVSQQISQLQQSPPIIHHLVQAAPQPHLHILRAPCRQQEQQQQSLETNHHGQEQQQQQQQQASQQQSSSTGECNNLARQQQQQQQRPQQQIEGIVADGGGPIVQWLLENYEIADGESLPRSTVYNHYLAHCRQLRISSVNAASFGKLIRSVFVGLKTRRLGTRGHSKYHYFGVRAKQHVRLDWIHDNDHHNHHNHHQMSASNGDDGQLVRRAGCSSSSSLMMRDLNNDNSNQNTDNGSESDSTGDCSGRLSSLGGSININNNNNNSTSKRIKRVHENSNDIDLGGHAHNYGIGSAVGQQIDHHHHHNQHSFEEIDHNHHHQQQQHQQQQQQQQQQQYGSHSDGSYYLNGYDDCASDIKQDRSNAWPIDGQYDLSIFKNHLGPNKDTLVDEHWPQCDPGSLERELANITTDRLAGGGGGGGGSGVRTQNDMAEDLSGLVQAFESQYKLYYKRMIDLLSNFNFNEIEHLWSEFWQQPTAPVAHETVQWSSDTDASNGINQQQHNSDQQLATPTGTNTNNISQQQQQQQLSYDQLHHHQQQPQHHQQMLQATITQTNLTFNQLNQLTNHPIMIDRINQIDYKLYSAIESFLIPDMLTPMPRPLMHHIRIFARNVGSWTESAISHYNSMFKSEKMKSVRAFEYALKRCTSINHLSTASRAIWNKRSVLVQMSIDLNRIDLRDIEHQMSLMSQAKFNQLVNDSQQDNDLLLTTGLQQRNMVPGIVEHNGGSRVEGANAGDGGNQEHTEIEQSNCLNSSPNSTSRHQNQTNDNIENSYINHDNTNGNSAINNTANNNNNNNSLQADRVDNHHLHQEGFCMMQPAQLIQNFLHLLDDPYPANMWPDWCRNLVESRVCGQSFEEARNFILKWNFYISLILRELTLRSAPSLGSFQLIRLLFDEYMYFLVVTRLAQAHHKTSTQLLIPSTRSENFQLSECLCNKRE